MRLWGIRALALSQGLSSCPARPKSATGHGARLTVSARSGHRLLTQRRRLYPIPRMLGRQDLNDGWRTPRSSSSHRHAQLTSW